MGSFLHFIKYTIQSRWIVAVIVGFYIFRRGITVTSSVLVVANLGATYFSIKPVEVKIQCKDSFQAPSPLSVKTNETSRAVYNDVNKKYPTLLYSISDEKAECMDMHEKAETTIPSPFYGVSSMLGSSVWWRLLVMLLCITPSVLSYRLCPVCAFPAGIQRRTTSWLGVHQNIKSRSLYSEDHYSFQDATHISSSPCLTALPAHTDNHMAAGSRKETLTAEEWVKAVFGSWKPADYLLTRNCSIFNTVEDLGCIINDPLETMGNPYLGSNITDTVLILKEHAEMDPCPRRKPLLVCVRGMGSGKTRLFEELRREMYLDTKVLPIAVTFNCKTGYGDGDIELEDMGMRAVQSAAISIITRMASVFYGLDFDKVQALVNKQIYELEYSFDSEDLYISFIQLMRDQLVAAGCGVNTFVLFVDETVRLQDALSEKYGRDIDVLCPLRSALLSNLPNSTLALSSLKAKIPGITTSGRLLKTLPQSERLDPSEILDKWWIMLKHESEETKARFFLIATLFCDMPRVLEAIYLNMKRSGVPTGDAIFSSNLIKYLRERVEERYSNGNGVPYPELLYGLWFRKLVPLTERAAEYILNSVFTNKLTDGELSETSQEKEVEFIPHANLIMLSLCALSSDEFSGDFKKVLDNILVSATAKGVDQQEGELLETVSALVLSARIMVAGNYKKSLTVAKLLGLEDCTISALNCIIPLTNTKYSSVVQLSVLKYDSHNYKEEALQELRDITVSATSPVALYRSARGEAYDMGMKVHDPSEERGCHYIFIDCKSKIEVPVDTNTALDVLSKEEFLKRASQAEHITALMEGESFVYVYQTTHPVEQTELGNWVYAGRSEAESFFGPVWDIYKALRGR